MKKLAAAVLVTVIVLAAVGCGGGSQIDPMTQLVESTAAMSEVSGYRMSGAIEMSSGDGPNDTVAMDIVADVQNVDGEVRQHMYITIGDYKVEAYIVGGVYYQNLPGQGWMKMSTGTYRTQSMNLGLVDAEQMGLMAELATNAEVSEENDAEVVVSFHLDKAYFDASMELYRQYIEEGSQQLPEELLHMEEAISDFQSDISMWVRKSDNLVTRMVMSYTMAGMPEVGDIGSSMRVDFTDFNQDISIELPEEALQAPEYVPE
jgi:hypothetical protein